MRWAAWFGATTLLGLMLVAGPVGAQTSPPPAAGANAPALPGPVAQQPQAQTQPAGPQVTGPQAAPAPTGLTLPPQPPPALPTAAPEQRGFLNGFGAWWDKSVADWKAKMKEQQSKIDTMNKQSADNAKDAATATQQALKSVGDAMMPSHVIDIHQTCPVAGNGAADCATAAATVCKSKGYNDGQPLDVRTAEKCSDSLWVSGQTPTAADCPVETTLLRAACR